MTDTPTKWQTAQAYAAAMGLPATLPDTAPSGTVTAPSTGPRRDAVTAGGGRVTISAAEYARFIAATAGPVTPDRPARFVPTLAGGLADAGTPVEFTAAADGRLNVYHVVVTNDGLMAWTLQDTDDHPGAGADISHGAMEAVLRLYNHHNPQRFPMIDGEDRPEATGR